MKGAVFWVVLGLLMFTAPAGAAEPKRPYIIIGHAPSTLHRIDNGGLSMVRLLATVNQTVLQIQPYQDQGLVFILSARDRHQEHALFLEVVDLSSVTTEMSYDIDLCQGCRYSASGLIVKNDQLIYLVKSTRSEGGTVIARDYVGLDIATGSMLNDLGADDARHAYSGLSGSNEPDTHQTWQPECRDCRIRQITDAETVRFFTSVRNHTGPINHDQATIYIIDEERMAGWKMGTETCHSAAAFGNWLVIGEPRASSWVANCYQKMMRGSRRMRLHFFNTLTGEKFLHDVGKPDNQVLMIDDDDVVYLRVVDELWRGQILDGGRRNGGRLDGDRRLNGMELIAKSVELLHARAMVFGHE